VEEQQRDERAIVVAERENGREIMSPEAPHEVSIIRPVASPEEVLAAWQQFQELKRSLLTLDDYQEIQGRARIKKSGWRKIAAAFGISDQLLREERREYGTPGQPGYYFVWEISSRAIAPNGRYADAVGSCASNERRFAHTDHDVRAVAHCVPLEAEILTRNGFRRYDQVSVGEDVLAYSVDDDCCYWTPLEAITVYPSLPMVRLQNRSFDVRCTPDHSWAVELEGERVRAPQRVLRPANALPSRGNIVLAAPAPGGDSPLTPRDAALLGWLCTDGSETAHWVTRRLGERVYHNGPYRKLQIDQSKPEYVAAIRELVGAEGREYASQSPPRTFPQGHTSELRPSHRFILQQRAGNALFERAGISSLADLPRIVTHLTVEARRAMLLAMLQAEGHRNGGRWYFSQTKPEVMAVFELLATLEGYALGRKHVAHAGVGNGACYRYMIRRHRYVYLPSLRSEFVSSAPAWCPTTHYGTWVMRLDGQITITGNTRSKNRAVADLVGGGEVSAEEIEGELAEAALHAPQYSSAPPAAASGRPAQASRPAAWRDANGVAAAVRQAAAGEPATDQQLRAIRNHLRRTGTEETTICQRAGVSALEELTRSAASDLVKMLSRQPNAA